MIKVHVVIKIKAFSDSPQTVRGNVYIIKQRAVLVVLTVDKTIFIVTSCTSHSYVSGCVYSG